MMKKTLYFLLVLFALATMGCDRKPKPTEKQYVSEFDAADMVILDHGDLQFYNAEKQTLTLYEPETDSVVNATYDENNHLYYTVLKDQHLELKWIDLNEKDPQPQHAADWNLTIDQVMNHMTNVVSDLSFDDSQKNVMIWTYTSEESFGFDKVLSYNIDTKQTKALVEDEMWNISFATNFTDKEDFYTDSANRLYHVTPQGQFCLNDKINFSQWFNEDEVNDVECVVESVSPDLKKVVYSAVLYWGEGWGYYCVADGDGSHQRVLEDSDIWTMAPRWLPDGSLVYVVHVPLATDDPDYVELDHYQDDFIRILTPDGELKTLATSASFAVKPFGFYRTKNKVDILGSDLVILDHGKMVFFNSSTNVFTPFEAEKDSVVNGYFVDDELYYYTVAIGDELYLKRLYLPVTYPVPEMLSPWNLKLDDCISETYGEIAKLFFLSQHYYIGINYHFNWDFYSFDKTRYYDVGMRKLKEESPEEDETDSYDEDFLAWDEDVELFVAEDGQYYYHEDGRKFCLTDKMDFSAYSEEELDPEEREFDFNSIDPLRKSVIFVTLLEWGDLGHGPLCFASMDGATQVSLNDTDAADLKAGWLQDGSLVYVGTEPRPTDDPDYDAEYNNTRPCIKRVAPDGTVSFFYVADSFITK